MIGKILGLSKDQVDAAKYAIKMRKQGYTLLKNPKGASNTEVNMVNIFHSHSMDDFHDQGTMIHRIKTTFNNGIKNEEHRDIFSTRFRDAETKELGKQRNVEYYRFDTKGKTNTEKTSFDIPEEDLKKRKKPNWQKGFLYHEYYADYLVKETVNNPARKPYYSKPGARFIVPILTFGLIKDNRPTRPNFFKVLWKNLHNQTSRW